MTSERQGEDGWANQSQQGEEEAANQLVVDVANQVCLAMAVVLLEVVL